MCFRLWLPAVLLKCDLPSGFNYTVWSECSPLWQRFITCYLLLCSIEKVGGSRSFCNCNWHAETLILCSKKEVRGFSAAL